MPLTVAQITQQIVNQLTLLDPSVSAEVGTPERLLIEANAELIASQQVDFTVLNQQYDLSSMTGGRLDAYFSVFNFGRQQGTPAYGTVTFGTTLAATQAIPIPAGTQVQANINNPTFPTLPYVTTQTVVLAAGQTKVNATVQCTIAGSIGNIDANSIVGFAGLQVINGISTVTNAQAMTGGTDIESDTAYVTRFRNTYLRNISGTNDQYLALAVAANGVTMANVVGPISRYQEYIQVPTSDDVAQNTISGGYDDTGTVFPHKRTTAESTIPYSKYTYPINYYITDGTLNPATANFFLPGVDYIFNTPPVTAASGTTQVVDSANPHNPDVTFLNPYDASANATGNPDIASGAVLLLEHVYISKNSRNDYSYGILNCVDIFVNGSQSASANSVEIVPTSSNNLQNTVATRWTYQTSSIINYRRVVDGTPAAVGNRLQPLYWQPVTALPNSVQIGTSTYYLANYYNADDGTYYNEFDGTTYALPAHYALVEEVSGYFGTIRCRNGFEWFLSGNNYLKGQLPTDSGNTYNGAKIDTVVGTQFTVTGYLYDQNVSNLQATMEKSKQTTTDVLVHKAKYRYFQPLVTVMYSFGATPAVVNASIIAALTNYFATQYYGSTIQLSDILQVIHNVAGVDNVRWTNPDSTGHKVQEVNLDGSSLAAGAVYYTNDFYLQDNELASSPNTNAVIVVARAQNTWSN